MRLDRVRHGGRKRDHHTAGGISGAPDISAPPRFDPFDTLPDLAPLRDAATRGDWPATAGFFARLATEEDRSFAAGRLADLDGSEHYLEKAVAASPGDPLARTLLAERYLRIGWEIRGRALAEHVSRDQFSQFHSWLRRAEQLLIEVCAEHPSYAHAWTVRVTSARGLQLGRTEARRRYDRLSAHHPHHYPAQTQLLQNVCPKWGGTWETAHEFARTCAAEAPDGSHAGALVAIAHLEHWAELDGVEQTVYMRGLTVRNDLRSAARVSVLHEEYRPRFHGIGAHNAFALAFSLGGHHADALPHFLELGDRASEFPWQYLSDPSAAFVMLRKAALSVQGESR
ncbi:tetratricopeptide repeat protein [Streptomyces sp. NPDC055056]